MGIKKNIEIFGDDYETKDGSCIRDYIHVCDLANAHVKALECFTNKSSHSRDHKNLLEKNCNIFNLGNGNGISVKEIINATSEISNKKIKVVISPRRYGDPPILVASSEKIKSVLGWEPRYKDIKEIINHAYLFHKKLYEKQ